MDITMVKVYPVQEEKLKAFVSVVFDHCFMVNDIKVIQGKDGLFLSMPSRRKKSGEFKDVAHPLNVSTRRMIEERVLREYWALVDDHTPRRPDRDPADGHPSHDGHGSNGSGRPAPAGMPRPEAPRPMAPQPEAAPPGTPPPAAPHPGAAQPTQPLAAEPAAAAADQTLEEVQEAHLRDSFWSVS